MSTVARNAMSRPAEIRPFLADTWWFGLTGRLDDDRFRRLVALRAEQGFTAAQLVVGIPPEVGPAHPAAASPAGPAWDLSGTPNPAYLRLARARIGVMNRHGLAAVVYGAWGPQVDWIGPERMAAWWARVVEACDRLDVVYCLTGESDLWTWPFAARALLPAGSTDELHRPRLRRLRWAAARRLAPAWFRARRRARWSAVLADLAGRTERPILVHATAAIAGFDAVDDPGRLAANSVQTGHARAAEPELWRRPLAARARHPGRPVVNLEPWYEGIRGQFWLEDQVRALWMSVGAGARALCYGAHGVWNVGDGAFLAHWGAQGFDEGLRLDTPAVLGATWRMLDRLGALDWPEAAATVEGGRLVKLRRADGAGRFVEYYPDAADLAPDAPGRAFDPLAGRFAAAPPRAGQAVLVS
jgi:hypothetical protein